MQLCLEFVVVYTHNEFQDFDLVLVSEIKMRAISKNNSYTIKLFYLKYVCYSQWNT